MSNSEIVKRTFLFQDSATTSTRICRLEIGDFVAPTGRTAGDFAEAVFKAEDGAIHKGWVPQKAIAAAAPPPRPELNRDGFIEICHLAARSINEHPATAPWFIAPDYLIARALLETGMKNDGPLLTGSDATGPLQMSSAEWAAFLADGAPHNDGFNDGLRDHPMQQIWGAAWTMHRDAKEMSRLKLEAGVGTAGDPFLPSYLDLFHAHLSGSPKAALAILDAQSVAGSGGKPVGEVLAGALTAAEVALFHQRRSRFAGSLAQPKSLTEFTLATEVALDEAFAKAFALTQQAAPQELPRLGGGEAPWYDFAETLVGIKEPDRRILDYFGATDFRPLPKSTETPWCGAFAAHCLAKSGDARLAQSIPQGAAAAASWKGWGNALPLISDDIPLGAIVVLSPVPGTRSTGHVGFFEKFDGGKVWLLGGNQDNSVSKKPFDRSRIVSVGWHGARPAESLPAVPMPPSDKRISQEAFELIVEFEVSSKQVYEKKYRHPEWPGFSSGVTVGIGYDVGYASQQQLAGDWAEVIPGSMISALRRAIGITGTKAKPLARQMHGSVDIPWDAAIGVHEAKVMPRWVSLVERTLPNTGQIGPDGVGALVSLVYNRGPSFNRAGERYREMRAIKDCMARQDYRPIPGHIRSMQRLWPSSAGLKRRREREAKLFERGIA